jgi:hypothetical protein
MLSFAFPYILKVNVSLPLRTPQENMDRSLGLSSPRDSETAPPFWVSSNPRLGRMAYPQATLLQYADDLLLCGLTEPVISRATESLLNFLADRGYKISKEKAQLCQSRVTYLGLVLEKEMRSLGEERICPILMFPVPKTLKELRAFWGVTGYLRIWILGFGDLARPLHQILKEAQKDTQPFIKWDDKSENAFHRLKNALMTAPPLGLPVQDKFQLYVYEKGGLALGVVSHLQGITPQPVGYLSKQIR